MSNSLKHAYNARVVGREEINPQLLILRVQPEATLFDFKPGQFAVLGLLGSAPRVAPVKWLERRRNADGEFAHVASNSPRATGASCSK